MNQNLIDKVGSPPVQREKDSRPEAAKNPCPPLPLQIEGSGNQSGIGLA